jgi:hypothetical protein
MERSRTAVVPPIATAEFSVPSPAASVRSTSLAKLGSALPCEKAKISQAMPAIISVRTAGMWTISPAASRNASLNGGWAAAVRLSRATRSVAISAPASV